MSEVYDFLVKNKITITIIVLVIIITYLLTKCNCPQGPKGDQGEKGQQGPPIDLSNYKGDINISGNISATGSIKSKNCELTCSSPTPIPPVQSSNSSFTILIVFVSIFGVGILSYFIYNYFYKNVN